MGPLGFCQTVSLTLGSRLAGARGTGACVCACVCVCVCMCVGEGAGREREEETAEFTKAAGRNQICSKGPATYARCGHSDLLWLELRTASS